MFSPVQMVLIKPYQNMRGYTVKIQVRVVMGTKGDITPSYSSDAEILAQDFPGADHPRCDGAVHGYAVALGGIACKV